MPVNAFVIQPPTGSLQAAYRPIVLTVAATATGGAKLPPFVICDIYINEVYYKSIFRTAPESIDTNSSNFLFDISDALQEYLQPDIAGINNADLISAPHMSGKVFCRFRASDVDTNGFTIEEGTRPVQATKFTPAVEGNGTQSNTFFVINSALQHKDNQDLASHLNYFKQGGWNSQAYPLTHRNTYHFCNDSSDHFPLIYSGPCTETDIVLHYRLKGSTEWLTTGGGTAIACEALEFSASVTGQRVFIHLASALPAGHQVQYSYKLSSAATWSDGVYKTAQDFFFDVTTPGDYDVRVVHFCSCCTNGPAVTHTFTIADNPEDLNLAWRGRDPFCEQLPLPQDIYIKLGLTNQNIETTYYPNSTVYYQSVRAETADLIASFFSDAAFLNPLTVSQELKIYVKHHDANLENDRFYDTEGLREFTVTANGTSVLLDNVSTRDLITSYNIGNTTIPTGQKEVNYTYAPYPTAKLINGNTGNQGFENLEQYNTVTNVITGVIKPNSEGDADYIAPLANAGACPSGAPFTNITYGYRLEIAKVEFRQGSTSIYGQTVANTGSGGSNNIVFVPKDQPTYISIKARTMDSGNTTGLVHVTVQFDDNTNQAFTIPDNIETQLPGTFKAISIVNISNY